MLEMNKRVKRTTKIREAISRVLCVVLRKYLNDVMVGYMNEFI